MSARHPVRRPPRAGVALIVAFPALAGASTPSVEAQERPGGEAPASIPGQPYLGFTVSDSLGRGIQAYVSEDHGGRALPLVLYVQGSGAGSLFRRHESGRVGGAFGHSTVGDVFSGTARVLLVEKPGVSYLDDETPTSEARSEFREEHTLDRWTVALEGAITGACSRAEIACDEGVLVIGHSEGGVAAARLAARSPAITHVALLAGEGPTQLYSLIALAREGVFFTQHGDDAPARIAHLLREVREVLRDPDAADRMFFGHPFRRWSSFLSSSPLDELRSTDARVFIGQGTADRAVSPGSADVLFASLAAEGKDVCYARIEGADHNFRSSGGDGWMSVLETVRDWAVGAGAVGAGLLCTSTP